MNSRDDEDTSIRRVNTWLSNERDRLTREAQRSEDAAGNMLGALVIVIILFVLYVVFTATGHHH